jgi:hypothetical protein
MNNFGDDVGVYKDSRAYDPAHHDHRGVKEIEFCGEMGR